MGGPGSGRKKGSERNLTKIHSKNTASKMASDFGVSKKGLKLHQKMKHATNAEYNATLKGTGKGKATAWREKIYSKKIK
jgi:hypothetical protein